MDDEQGKVQKAASLAGEMSSIFSLSLSLRRMGTWQVSSPEKVLAMCDSNRMSTRFPMAVHSAPYTDWAMMPPSRFCSHPAFLVAMVFVFEHPLVLDGKCRSVGIGEDAAFVKHMGGVLAIAGKAP